MQLIKVTNSPCKLPTSGSCPDRGRGGGNISAQGFQLLQRGVLGKKWAAQLGLSVKENNVHCSIFTRNTHTHIRTSMHNHVAVFMSKINAWLTYNESNLIQPAFIKDLVPSYLFRFVWKWIALSWMWQMNICICKFLYVFCTTRNICQLASSPSQHSFRACLPNCPTSLQFSLILCSWVAPTLLCQYYETLTFPPSLQRVLSNL